MSDFGDELARLMAVRSIGVRDLGRQVHYNAGHISNLKNDRARPSAELARAVDKALDADGSLDDQFQGVAAEMRRGHPRSVCEDRPGYPRYRTVCDNR
jgi:transcriptional regulator with XRE-family HTH domain